MSGDDKKEFEETVFPLCGDNLKNDFSLVVIIEPTSYFHSWTVDCPQKGTAGCILTVQT